MMFSLLKTKKLLKENTYNYTLAMYEVYLESLPSFLIKYSDHPQFVLVENLYLKLALILQIIYSRSIFRIAYFEFGVAILKMLYKLDCVYCVLLCCSVCFLAEHWHGIFQTHIKIIYSITTKGEGERVTFETMCSARLNAAKYRGACQVEKIILYADNLCYIIF